MLSNSDKIKEQIKFNTELLKILAVALLTTAGGTITLYVQSGSDALTVWGTLFVTLFGILGAGIVSHTHRLLK